MTWQTPKTNWQAADVVSKDDFNRIEGNIQELQDTKETPAGAQAKVNTHAGSKQTHGISGSYYIAKTSRSDQLPAWNDIQGKPSLVTSSDLSNGLATKVNKPSSATSGNIAVFDGGANKIKDGGSPVRIATGTYGGNGTRARKINAGFKPVLVMVYSTSNSDHSLRIDTNGGRYLRINVTNDRIYIDDIYSNVNLTSNGFTVGNDTNGFPGNKSNITYCWEAIG